MWGQWSLLASRLDPTPQQAREWAIRELSDPSYASARPGLVQRLLTWLFEKLSQLQVPAGLAPSRGVGLALLVLLLALALLVVLRRTGRLRRATRAVAPGAVLDDVRRSAAEHRRLAEQAAAAGRFDVAVRERFRAVARALEERAILDERPGRTAREVAAEAALALPALTQQLREGARLLDDVCYGSRPANATQDAALTQLDVAVAHARPALEPAAAAPLPGPPR